MNRIYIQKGTLAGSPIITASWGDETFETSNRAFTFLEHRLEQKVADVITDLAVNDKDFIINIPTDTIRLNVESAKKLIPVLQEFINKATI